MMMKRTLRSTCHRVLLVALLAMAPGTAPVAADAEIAARGADGAPVQVPFNLVKAAQRFLAGQAGQDYQPGPVDGIPGPKTRAAVMAWQRDHALEANGVLNAATLASMGLGPQ
jgi:peptidoglycan hydrolase-like protein with peptidoglycan-binding domain